jgi:hypothetical protein
MTRMREAARRAPLFVGIPGPLRLGHQIPSASAARRRVTGASTRARVGARGSTRGFYIGMRLLIGVLERYRMAHTRKHGKNHVFEVPSRRSGAGRVCDAAE